jgi:predicted aldo/keto reductase-like oxidoreductase
MSNHSWNRRDFIVKPVAGLAASHLLGGLSDLLGQTPAAQTTLKPICRTLGKTGISVPIVSMGVMNADVPGLIKRSYELGVRHFDTAAHYQQGRNEQMVGNMIQEMGVRGNVVISTKILRPDFGRSGSEAATRTYTPTEVKAHFFETFAASQKRLQMDHVDILYNHACDTEAQINSEGAIEALTQLKKEGKTRFIGVSGHQPELLLKQATKSGVYDVALIIFNYTMARDEGLLKAIDEAAKSGIGIVAMKTQSGGMMPPNPNRPRNLPPESQTAMLKWVLQHESITTAIPGYTRYEHLEQNFSVASNLTLTPGERDFLADKRIVAEAQFCRQCGECLDDCPHGVDIPTLMRSHMYAVQYSNRQLATETVALIAQGKGLDACTNCETCKAGCRNTVDVAMKIQHLKQLTASGALAV